LGSGELGALLASAAASTGRGKNQGSEGGAVRDFGEVKLAVFTVVNPIGAVLDRSGEVVRERC